MPQGSEPASSGGGAPVVESTSQRARSRHHAYPKPPIADCATARDTEPMGQAATASNSTSTGFQVLVLAVSFAVTVAYLGLVVRRLVFPIDSFVPSGSPLEVKLKAIEFERDRIGALSKGIAGGAAAFISALLIAIVKDELSAQLSFVVLLGLFAGSVGLLTLAACLSRLVARHVSSALGTAALSSGPPP